METRHVRYITMNGLRAILDQQYDPHFDAIRPEDVIRLKAKKSITKCREISQPLLWMKLRQADHFFFEIDYSSFMHGTFAKRAMYDLIDEWKLEDVPVQEIGLRLRKDTEVAKTFSEICKSPELEHQDWVALFEEYTLRQENGGNSDFANKVRENHTLNGLGKLRFQTACLDLVYVLPFREWKEVIEGRMTKNRRYQFERWKVDFQQLEPKYLRMVMTSLFPKDMHSARTYAKTQKNVWTLVKGSGD